MSIAFRVTQRRVPIDKKQLECTLAALRSLAGYSEWSIGCWIASDRTVASLNKQYRHKRGVTDILSFSPHSLSSPEHFDGVDPELRDLGDIIIAADYVRKLCARDGLNDAAHYDTLLCHGLVHLLGYDHETDEQHAVMAAKEADLLEKLSKWREREKTVELN